MWSFDKLVLPVLMYGCDVCGFYIAKAIEQVLKDVCSTVLKVKRTPMNEIYMEIWVVFQLLF